jgi:hypothetical protein
MGWGMYWAVALSSWLCSHGCDDSLVMVGVSGGGGTQGRGCTRVELVVLVLVVACMCCKQLAMRLGGGN